MLTVNRKSLINGLNKCKLVAGTSGNVGLASIGDTLTLTSVADFHTLQVDIDATGKIEPAVINLGDFLKRAKASKTETAHLATDDETVTINGGRVEYTLPIEADTLDTDDIGFVNPDTYPAETLLAGLSNCREAMARESTRYAINGVLIEGGRRLVATDGRRMVVADISSTAAQETAIMPGLLVAALTKILKGSGDIRIEVTPSTATANRPSPAIAVAGDGWRISAVGVEGSFPDYKGIIPADGVQYEIDGKIASEIIKGVAIATDEDSRGMRLDFNGAAITATCRAGGKTATADIPAATENTRDFKGAINPVFMLDAIKHLSADRFVIDVQTPIDGHWVCRPYKITGKHQPDTTWIVMPVRT